MDDLKRVGCVEDDESIRMIINLALKDIGGMDVVSFSNGLDAIQNMAAHRPQMMVLDVMMPQMDGLQTLQNLRKDETLRDVPAIFMTAKAQPSEIAHYRELGAVDVVVKPFDPMTLAESLRQIWRSHYTD